MTGEYEINICSYFNGVECEKRMTKKDIGDICLSDDHTNCDEYILIEKRRFTVDENELQ